MANTNSQTNLSSSQIIKATIIALVSSIIIGIVAVLPAEYGKDYTGLGKALGFSRLYQDHNEIDTKIADKQAIIPVFKQLTLEDVGSEPTAIKPAEANNPAPAKQYESRSDSVKITIPIGKGLEYKITVLKYGQVKYAWKSSDILFVDLHGDAKTASKKNDYYESYAVANSSNMAGSFIAPYEGKHGWYFKNKTTKPITVNITLSGEYQLINQ